MEPTIVTNALTGVDFSVVFSQVQAVITQILPIALPVLGLIIGIRFVPKLIKMFVK